MDTDVLLSPLELPALEFRELRQTTCVVLDILRATTVMVTALANGAQAILPVSDIAEALDAKARHPEVLLAGERNGLRITRELTGSVDFDLGNSPREFTRSTVEGRRIVSTTTNGTRALRSCATAHCVLATCFANLTATLEFLETQQPKRLLIVASGTGDHPAYEDLLAAGALCEGLQLRGQLSSVSDAVEVTQRLYREIQSDLPGALAQSHNGKRLLTLPALAPDVALCAQQDSLPLVARLNASGWLERSPGSA